jgi:ATP/ADP translocase
MPYNVIIMTSTVMAVFFGSIQGRLIRRWGWVWKGNDHAVVDASESETKSKAE